MQQSDRIEYSKSSDMPILPEQTRVFAKQGSFVLSIALLVVILAVQTIFWIVAVRAGWATAEENGALEDVQAVTCLFCALGFGLGARRRTDRLRQVFYSGLALLCFSFFMRELDVSDLGVPAFITWVCEPFVRNIWVSALWVIYAFFAIPRLRDLILFTFAWLRSYPGYLLIAGGVLLVCAGLCDSHLVPIPKSTSRLCEEVIESNGFLLLLASAIHIMRRTD